MEFNEQPIAKAEFLIRKPAAEVFEAFADPEIVTNFWFDKSSGRLETGQTVQWTWEMCDMTIDVRVLDVEENERILVEWGTDGENTTTVEWTFTARSADTTFVTVINKGFTGDGDKIVSAALDSTGGFTLVLAAAKAWLEHGIRLNIVADRF